MSIYKNVIKSFIIVMISFTLLVFPALAIQPDLTASEKNLVVKGVIELLQNQYISAEHAKLTSTYLAKKLAAGNYNSFNSPAKFAQQLTQDVQALTKDKHLRVFFDPKRVGAIRSKTNVDEKAGQQRIQRRKFKNYGFKSVEVLGGNVGYLDIHRFDDTEYAGETAVAAMGFLANTDALIIDLRNNGGGSPSMVQLLASYLVKSDPVHLNNFYSRKDSFTKQTWSLPYVPGQRLLNNKVYILIGSNTFSAAEDFSYTLKHLNRATLIGESTAGGANPGGRQVVSERFVLWLPTKQAINPNTQTNWEQVGVKPDIEVAEDKAFDTAYLLALNKLKQTYRNSPEVVALYDWQITSIEARSNTFSLSKSVLQNYVGVYGPRKISIEEGELYYQRGKGNKYQLMAIDEVNFIFKEMDDFRLRFIKQGKGIVALAGLYDDGSDDINYRTNPMSE